MSWFTEIRERVAALVFRRRHEREMEEELRFHLEREAAERVKEGSDAATATRQAAVAFGGRERYREEIREARGTALLEQLVADLRYAARALWHSPGFTAAAVLVLGVAIGASGAVFAVTDAILFSDLPYPNAERLVRIFQQNSPTNRFGLSTVEVQAIQDQQKSFAAFGAVSFGLGALAGTKTPETVLIGRATSGFFRALDVPAAAGRLIQPTDEGPGAPRVAVVTDQLARRSLGGVPGALGRLITLDGVNHEVVGILPPGVNDLAAIGASAWSPLVLTTPTRRGPFGTRGFARLRDGVTLSAAAADLAGISRRIYPTWATSFRDSTAKLTPLPLRESIVGTAASQLNLFAAAVVLVLLVAVANVATLQLVRASARSRELAVRAALGAGRARLARFVASEGAVLTLLAGLGGFAIAWTSVRLVAAAAPRLPRVAEVSLGLRGTVMIAVLALISGALVSISPVAAALSRQATGSLRADTRRTGTGRGTNLLRGALVAAEFALALPLLLGAGLLLNSFLRLQQVDPGFDPDGAIAVQLTLPAARYPNDTVIQQFWRQVLARAQEIPGLTTVGLAAGLPPNLDGATNNFNLVQRPVTAGGAEYISPWSVANTGFFQALGIPLVEGRLFNLADSMNGAPVVLVSRTWASRYFPGETAVGKEVISGGCYQCPHTTVIGVVGDVKFSGMAGDGEGVYNAVEQSTQLRTMNLVARTRLAPAEAFMAFRRELAAIDPELPMVETVLTERLHASLADPRRWTSVLGAFAGAALILAALGIFGLMSYIVRQRRREIGVRLALGAEPGAVTRMIVGRGMRYALIGTALGLGISLLEARWLRALLYGVGPSDPVTLVASALVLLLAAFCASLLPGWRAAHIRPIEAMQTE